MVFSIVLLVSSLLLGSLIYTYLFKHQTFDELGKISISFFLGIYVSTWIIFLLALAFKSTFWGVNVGIILIDAINVCLIIRHKPHLARQLKTIKLSISKAIIIDLLFIFLAVSFSFWFTNQHFHDTPKGNLMIGQDVWGDFDIHLPLIRSFSLGNNYPPSLPDVPNKNSAYHFLYDYASAEYEFLGLSLANSINILSILSMTALLILLYRIPTYFFKASRPFGFLSAALFLCNGSFGFLDAIRKLNSSSVIDFFTKIWTNTQYLSVSPFQKDLVSIIWNLNIYANQRHLLFAFGIALIIVLVTYTIIKDTPEKSWKVFALLGVLVGLLPFWQIHVFVAMELYLVVLLLFLHPSKRKLLCISLLSSLLIALPQLAFLKADVRTFLTSNPGFLSERPLTIITFLQYWFYNLGCSLFTIPVGIFLMPKKYKAIFLSLMSVFIVGNIFQFNSQMMNNHKLFNLWLTIENLATIYLIIRMWSAAYIKWLIIPLVVLLTFTGLTDMMIIKNETFYEIADTNTTTLSRWVITDTKPTSIFLIPNSTMYNSITMAGRKILQLDPRYGEDYGYDITKSNKEIKELYEASNKKVIRELQRNNHISYIVLPINKTDTNFFINYSFYLTKYPEVFSDSEYTILKVD